MTDMRSARDYLADAITDYGEDFDVEAILAECYEAASGWDFDRIAHDEFWAIVASHDHG